MPEPADDESLREWLRRWGDCVANADFEAAKQLFAADVIGFGTRAGIAEGLDELATEQWQHVWPSISGFEFDVDGARLYVADDRRQAVVATMWTSAGTLADGTVRRRPGRATVVLRRTDVGEPWLGVHTHFSLTPAPTR